MIDLSFLTDAEQEAILKVLHRDAELKKSEEERIRQLHDETEDENELKYKSGQWFYEAKSKRHRDKIHGADLVRASIRKRKSPATIAELSQSSKNKSQRRWVNSINQEIFIPPELYGIMEPPDETEEDLKPSMTESNQSAKKVSFDSPNTDKDIMKNGTASPAKQRKNPFNAEGVVGETVLDNGVPDQSPEAGQVNGQEGKKNIMSSIYKYGVKLPYPAPIGGRQTSPEAEDDPPPQRPPVPKPRTLVLNGQPPDRSNSSVQREDSFNGTNKPKGILKRRSSSSSTDSESIRIPQNGEPIKLVLPSSPILEAEQTHLSDNQVTSSENSPDRQKQVRFSENVLQKPPTPNPETYSALEFGEFGILDHGAYQNELDFEFVDHPPYEESKPTQYSDVDHVNSTEVLGQNSLKENPSVSLTIQTPSNSAPILDAEKKLEDPSQGVNHNGEYEILDESYPETNIDSAGPEPLYAAVKKPSKSTSSNQEKDFDLDDALMEPRFLGQRGKIENAYQSEKPLEFGKSYGGAGKINYGSPSQPGKVYVSTNEDVLTPEMASNEQSSYRDFVDDPKLKTRVDDPKLKTRDSDYFPKWRRPNSFENEDLLSQPRAVQEFPKVNSGEQADPFVKPDPENRTNSTYSPGKYKIDTRYKSMFLRNTPEVEGGQVTQSSNLPVAQNMPFSSTPESESFQTREMFLLENRERKELPKSANFKVMSLKERIHDMPREQMANPSQFQSLKHFWNVEDKNQSKGDVDTSPSRMLKDVLKRNKPVQADRKQRNSTEIPAHDLSLPSSFDSLSEEEQTSHKVASWLAQTPTVYVAEQVDANEDQVHPGEDVMENIEKTQVDRNDQAEEFSSALQKLAEEALEAPKIAATERPKRETVQISPIEERGSMDWKKTSPAILVSSAEKKRPASGFYDRVVHISSTKPPAKETKIVADTPAISSKQYPREEVKEDVERREAPAKTADEFKIGFQKLMEEYQSTSNKSDDEHQEEEPNLPSKEQQLIETEEIIDKSSIPKGYEHQEFISALKKLEVEASKSPIIEDQDEQPETISTLKMVSPMKSSFKIGSEHLAPVKLIETEENIEKSSTPKGNDNQEFISALKKLEVETSTTPVTEDLYEEPKTISTVSPMKSSFKIGSEHLAPVELIETEENIEKSSTPKGNDNQEFISALKKLEVEASTTPVTEDQYEEPKTVSTLNTLNPMKSSFKIGFEHLAPVELIETEENIERSFTPKGYEQQEFISALKKLEVEASKSPIIEDQDEQPETVSTLNTVNPIKSSFKIGFEHLAPVELIETEENIEKSSTPKGYEHQEFISALKKLEVEASASPIIEDEYEEPKTVSTLNTVSPMKSSFKIGFEHFTPVEDDSMESPQKRNVTYTVKSSPPNDKDTNEIEEVVERTTEPSRIDETDFSAALRKLEHEAAIDEPSTEVEETYENPTMTPTLQSTRSISTVQNMPTPSFSVENKSDLEEPYPYRAGNSAGPDDTYVISKRERPKYTLEKLPVEEEPIEKTIIDAKENSADYLKQIMRLEEEAAASAPEEPVDLSYGETFHVSQAPTKDVLISKRVFSSQESMPTELPSSAMPKDLSQPQTYAYKELANSPQSPSDLSGSFTGSAENVLYKKPDTTPEVSKSKKGKPAPAGSPNDSDSTRHDRYTFEGMKAQDESISKVLEWFSKSSDSIDDQLPSVGLLEKSKTTPPQTITSPEKTEESPGPNIDTLADGIEASPKMKSIPKMSWISETKEDMKEVDPEQPKILKMTSLSSIEDESVPPQQVTSTEFLEFGNSGSGCGKIQSRSINGDPLQESPQLPERVVLGKDKEGLEESSILKVDVGDTEGMADGKIKDQSEVLSPTLEQNQGQIFEKTEKDKSNVPQKRESDIELLLEGDDQLPSVGLLEKSKTPPPPPQTITYPDKTEESPGSNIDNLADGIEASPKRKSIPKMSWISETKEDLKNVDLEQPKILKMTSLSSIEDESIPPQQVTSTEFLEFGNSGSGCGKIQSRSINGDSLQESPQLPERVVLGKDKEGLEESSILKVDVGDTEGMPDGKRTDQSEVLSPTLEENPGQISEKTEEDKSIVPQKIVGNIELLWEGGDQLPSVGLLEKSKTPPPPPPPPPQTITYPEESPGPNIDNLANGIEASPKIKSIPKMSLISDTKEDMKNVDPDQPKILKMTSLSSIEDESVPPQQVTSTEFLEFGNSGSGCGKIQSRSINGDTLQESPQLPERVVLGKDKEGLEESSILKVDVGNTEGMPDGKIKDQSEVLSSTLEENQGKISEKTEEDKSIVPQKRVSDIELLWEGDDQLPSVGLLEKPKTTPQTITYPDKTEKSPGPNIDTLANGVEASPKMKSIPKMSWISETKEDMKNVDPDQPKILKMTSLSSIEDESVPPQQVTSTEFLEFGNSGSGCGKIQSRSINGDPLQESPVLGKDKEGLEEEKEESSILKEGVGNTEGMPDGKIKDQSEVLGPTLEQNQGQTSEKTEKDKSIVPQKRVSDIKLLWEGERSSQDTTKKPVLSNIKRPFSPVELSITPKSGSFDSDDQSSASLVTFRKVLVEDEEDPPFHVDQLKSFWENEKNKDTTKGKVERPYITIESSSDDQGAPRSNFQKRHTIHNFFEQKKSTELEKNLPGRSISLGESANESLKDRLKSTSFQNLKNFWNVPSKSDDKRTNQALQENMTKQFGSNPDIRSNETLISRAKSRLAAKSLQDIREDPSAVPQFQAYDAEPMPRKFGKTYSKKEDPKKSLNKTETLITPSNTSGGNNKLVKPINSVEVMLQESSVPPNYLKSSSTVSDESDPDYSPGIADKYMAPTEVVIENSVAPKEVAKSEISLKLKTSQDEVSPGESPESTTVKNRPDDQNVFRDEENGEMNARGRKLLLVKQSKFDAGSPVLSNVSEPLQETEQNLSENEYPTGNDEVSDSREVVDENIEKTVIPLQKDSGDFDRKLQNLYNEFLNTADLQNGNPTEHEYIDLKEPDQNFSKVLAVSSGASNGHQPIIINVSSKKTEIGDDDLSNPQQNSPTDTSLVGNPPAILDISSSKVHITSEEPASELKGSSSREPEVDEFSSESNDYNEDNSLQPEELSKKEIIERIEMPTVLPKTHFNDFNEKLNQLYKESQMSWPNLEEAADSGNVVENNEHIGEPDKDHVYVHVSEPKKTFLKSFTVNLESPPTLSADGETRTDESAPSGSQAPDILEQEVNETIEKTVAPTRISNAKSLEELQKEAMDEEEGGFIGSVSPGHVALNESQYKPSHQGLRENSVSESFPRESEDTVQEGTEPAGSEDPQEGSSETNMTFISDRQSTPVKDTNGSLRRSTLELFLAAPYRREISKSIDFDLSGYVTSDVNKCMDISNPVLRALNRSAAKTLNAKAVQEVSPTSTNESKPNNQEEDTLAPIENSFPENAEKFKRMSQSVPTFLQDDTDGRETDSASESSFQIGRHKKSPSSLTNLSGSSGMASMSSVSGSIMSVYSGDFGNVDIKGGIEFSIDYVEQLKEFHIYIYQCKELAAADVKKQRSDPYVKAYLLPEKAKMGKRKTAVKKKSLNPVYNEILRYKIPKQSLEAQTLNLSVWHHDALGRNSFLGEVNLNLASWDWNNTQRNWYQLEPRVCWESSIGDPGDTQVMSEGQQNANVAEIVCGSDEGGCTGPGRYTGTEEGPSSQLKDCDETKTHQLESLRCNGQPQVLTPASGVGLENRGEMKLSLKYLPVSAPEVGKKQHTTGEVHIWIRECIQLPMLRENKINSFVKCTILPDTSRKSRQKTRAVDKTPSPIFNHTMVYDGFKEEDLREACVELTVWDHNKLSNHFLGGLRIGLGTGKSYGTAVDWMDASHEESIMWEKMIATPNTWIDGLLPLRMFKMAKLAK